MLPARMEPYFTAWLDSLMQTSNLLWFGCGERKLSFAFPEDLDLFQQDHTGRVNGKELIPDPKGRYSFSTIHSHSGLSVETFSGQLWKLTWKGELSNDSFATVRKGIVNRFRHYELEEQKASRRLSANRWKTGKRTSGNWHLLGGGDGNPDVIEKEEMNKERVRVLLDRYGILFRELLLRELPLLQWNNLFRTLRIMELSGEVLSGSFFSGIPGLQFISHEAFRVLNKGLPEDSIYWLNAADPASLCGTGLEGLRADLPPRTPMTHLVYHGTRLVVISRRHGKELKINVDSDDPHLSQYFSFFRVLVSREFNPKTHILIEHINGTPARQSEYRNPFREFGFQDSYKGMELWRKY
jgi:ATP-dependent Lhr-like helicase